MSASETAANAVREHAEDLIELSHFVHAHPELGYEEFLSSGAVADAAERAGFEVERGIASLATAFRASKGSGALHVVYCAEFDALPDVGHACGHNIIAASSLGAAIGLAAVADELDVKVTLLGTPSEEGGGGKIDLINAGYFDDVHAAMMVHPFPFERLDAHCPGGRPLRRHLHRQGGARRGRALGRHQRPRCLDDRERRDRASAPTVGAGRSRPRDCPRRRLGGQHHPRARDRPLHGALARPVKVSANCACASTPASRPAHWRPARRSRSKRSAAPFRTWRPITRSSPTTAVRRRDSVEPSNSMTRAWSVP